MMHRPIGAILVAATTMAILASSREASAQDASRIDVPGKWTFQVETQAGSGTPTVTLKQSGDTLTGHYSSTTLGEADLTDNILVEVGGDPGCAFGRRSRRKSPTV